MGYAGTGDGHVQTRERETRQTYEETGILTRMHLPDGYEFDLAQEPVRYGLRKKNELLIAEDTNVAEEDETRFRGKGTTRFEALQSLATTLVSTLEAHRSGRTINEVHLTTLHRLESLIKKAI